MKKTHSEIADFYDSQYHTDTGHPNSPTSHHQKLVRKLGVRSQDTVLDIACGKGDWLQACSNVGAKIFGVDISETAIIACRKRIPDGDFLCQPAETLPYSDDMFDIVTCLGSLEHFLDQEKAIREMCRVAKPGAKILILVPNSGFLTYRLGLYKGTNQQAAYETLRSLSEWLELFTNNGLNVEKRWKDLHVMQKRWIFRRPYRLIPLRLAQALLLFFWPLEWQYQVYHLCFPRETPNIPTEQTASRRWPPNRSE